MRLIRGQNFWHTPQHSGWLHQRQDVGRYRLCRAAIKENSKIKQALIRDFYDMPVGVIHAKRFLPPRRFFNFVHEFYAAFLEARLCTFQIVCLKIQEETLCLITLKESRIAFLERQSVVTGLTYDHHISFQEKSAFRAPILQHRDLQLFGVKIARGSNIFCLNNDVSKLYFHFLPSIRSVTRRYK